MRDNVWEEISRRNRSPANWEVFSARRRRNAMPEQPMMTGGCQCGAVRYALYETPESTVCHCRMCQKAVGGPFAALSKLKTDNLRWTRGTPARFQSSSAAERHFCADCGTPLTFHFLD